MNRRNFLAKSAALCGAALFPDLFAAGEKPKRILLRSSWQTVNIGDIGHTPGILHLLEAHLPEAEVRLWPSKIDNGVEEMLRARFPNLVIAKSADELKAAFEECDFFLHSSAASFGAEKDVAKWRAQTGKPFGVYGITFSSENPQTIELLSSARFVFFRDSISLEFAKKHGVKSPVMEFGPDAAFAVDLRDEEKASAFLRANRLEEGKFLCCIPRLRFTPYWKIPGKNTPFDKIKHARNETMKEHDHAPLREAIVAVTRQTKMKVLLCPEDRTQMAVGKEMLLEKLPDDVRARVVWRENYWLTGEALSTYVRSAGLFGNEMHSPIMCIGNGVPAIVCRWAEQTSKGIMWRDIGLGDWLFDLDDEKDVAQIAPTVLAMAKDPAAAKAKAAKALEWVKKRQRETMAVVRKNLAA